MSKQNNQKPSLPQLEMPDIVGLPRNWDILMEYLRQRRYTSGDVEACIGVSRKVLLDWDRGASWISSIRGWDQAEEMNASENGGSSPFSTFGTLPSINVFGTWGLIYPDCEE